MILRSRPLVSKIGSLATGLIAVGILVAMWAGRPNSAIAQIPDSGAQRQEMLAEQRLTNQRLAEIIAVLREIRDQNAVARPERPTRTTTTPARP